MEIRIQGIEDVSRVLQEIAPREAINLLRATTADLAKGIAKLMVTGIVIGIILWLLDFDTAWGIVTAVCVPCLLFLGLLWSGATGIADILGSGSFMAAVKEEVTRLRAEKEVTA